MHQHVAYVPIAVSGKEAQQRKRLSPIVNAIGAVEFHDIREETTPHDKYEGDDEEEEEGGDGGSDTATEIYEPGDTNIHYSFLCLKQSMPALVSKI